MSDKRVFEIEADGVEFDAEALWIALCGYGRFAQTKVRVREVLPEPPLTREERISLAELVCMEPDALDSLGLLDRRACRAKIEEGKL
jgi:hypothetical protein